MTKKIILGVTMALMIVLTSASAFAEKGDITVIKNGSQESFDGSEKVFTGDVRIDPLYLQPEEPFRTTAAYVTFDPGARTAWHSHPVGQILLITSGSGFVQQEGYDRIPVQAGDVVFFPKGVKHWHGATETTPLVHVAIQEQMDGSAVEWKEHVSDKQYKGE